VIGTDEDLAIRLLREASVIAHPGHFYDFPDEGRLVLSLITEPADFREGVTRLLQVVE
jgi:aspartate/methionine/tyrosine aminotransferase